MHLFGWLFEWDEHRMDRGRSWSSVCIHSPYSVSPNTANSSSSSFSTTVTVSQWHPTEQMPMTVNQHLDGHRGNKKPCQKNRVVGFNISMMSHTHNDVSENCFPCFLVFLVVGKCFCCILIFPPLAAPPPVVWVISGAHALGYRTVLNAGETIYPMFFLTHADNYAL